MNSSSIATPQCPYRLIFWQDDPSFASSPHVPSRMVQWFHERWYRFGRTNDMVVFILGNDNDSDSDGRYITGLFATTLITGTMLLIWMSLILLYSQRRRHKLPTPEKQRDIYRKIKQKEVLLEYQQDDKEHKYYGRPFSKPLPPREPEQPDEEIDDDADIADNAESKNSLTSEEKKLLRKTRIKDYHRDVRRFQADLLGYEYAKAVYKRRINGTRITVVAGCLIVIICSTLFYINGAKQLGQVAHESKRILQQVQNDAHHELTNRIQEFLAFSESSNMTRILDYTNTYCPLVRPRICPTSLLTDPPENCNWSGIPHATLVQSWIDALIEYQTTMTQTMQELQHDLDSSRAELDDWMSTLANMEFGLTLSTIFVFVLDALCLYILLGVAIAWSKQRKVPYCFIWIRSYCLIPLFAVVVIVCWIFASTFVLASLTTSDFCHDGPNQKVVALLQRAGDSLSPTFADLIRHYVTSCTNVFVPDIFSSDIDQLVQSVRDAKLLQSNLIIFANGMLKDICGPFAESVLSGTASLAEGELCQAASLLHESRVNLKCSTWNPIFTSVAQDMLCKDAMDAFSWITFSQLVIVFVSMVILTFRVALLPVQYVRWQPRAKALSRKVAADLKKISGLAQALSEERLDTAKIEPVYYLGYASSSSNSSSNRTAESVSDYYYAEVSTTKPSNSDSNSFPNLPDTVQNMPRVPTIAPKMVDDDEDLSARDESSSRKNKPESNITLMVSNQQQQAAPIIRQTVAEMDEDESDCEWQEKKPESESLHSEAIPPVSQRSMISETASSVPASSQRSMTSSRAGSESIPPVSSQRSMTSRVGSAESQEDEAEQKPESYSMHSIDESSAEDDAKPESALRVLMSRGASVQSKLQTDDSSFEEFTIRSDSDIEEATCYSMSSHKRASDISLEESSKKSNISHSEKKSKASTHSRRSERYLSSLEDVAEESPGHGISPQPIASKVQRFAPGNAFMDHLLIDNDNKTAALPHKAATKPPRQLSLPLELAKLNARAGPSSSLVGSMGIATSKSIFSAENSCNAKEESEGGADDRVDDDSGHGPSRNPERFEVNRRSSRSLMNIEAVKTAELTKGDDESFHFSLNLDMDTYHSADFGDFSGSEVSLGDTFAAVEYYEIIEEEIIQDEETSERNLPPALISEKNLRRSTSISAISVDPEDPAYKSYNSEEVLVGKGAKVSSHSRRTANGDDKTDENMQQQFQKTLMWDTSAVEARPIWEKISAKPETKAKHIDVSALQQRVDSIRSVGSIPAGMPRALDAEVPADTEEAWTEDRRDKEEPSNVPPKEQMRNLATKFRSTHRSWRADSVRSHGSKPWRADSMGSYGPGLMKQKEGEASVRSVEFELTKPHQSNRSLASSPSIAISAATMNENQFYLDDMGGSSDSFAHGMLPSRAIDSEMLAIVDESWTDDSQDQEIPSSQQTKARVKNLAKKHQPQSSLRYHQPQQIFLQGRPDSVRSLGMDSFSGSMSDDFDNSFDKPKKPMSGLSLASNSPSIAISAATLNEKQYHLDDMGGSGGSFGQAMLPSRAMDSEMLAVVDEAWAEDAQESPSIRPARKRLEMLYELDEKTASLTE